MRAGQGIVHCGADAQSLKQKEAVMLKKSVVCTLVLVASFAHALISPSLQEQLSTAQPDQKLPVQIVLNQQYDNALLNGQVEGMTRPERRVAVANILREYSAEQQASLAEYLSQQEAVGAVTNIKSLWIVDAMYCEAIPAVVQVLAARPDVEYVNYDLLQPSADIGGLGQDGSPEQVAWGVSKINAPAVWTQGYTGQGVVCGHIDLGCNYNHQDLADHMWTDPNYPHHGWDFADDDDDPMDEDGHGTLTAGVVAGDGTGGTSTGVAPDHGVPDSWNTVF
jgi:subtilisin family serine protease